MCVILCVGVGGVIRSLLIVLHSYVVLLPIKISQFLMHLNFCAMVLR